MKDQQEEMRVNVIFRDDEIDIYEEVKLHALKQRISATEYIKQALEEKNLKSRVSEIAKSK